MEPALKISFLLFLGCNPDIHTVHISYVCQREIQLVKHAAEIHSMNFASLQPVEEINECSNLCTNTELFYRLNFLSFQVPVSVLETM